MIVGIESLKIIPLDDGWSDSQVNEKALDQAKSHDGKILSAEAQEQNAIDALAQPTDGAELSDHYLHQEMLDDHADK